MMTQEKADDESDSGSDSDSDLAFNALDFTGVDFDSADVVDENMELSDIEAAALLLEENFVFGRVPDDECLNSNELLGSLKELSHFLVTGKYVDALRGEVARKLFGQQEEADNTEKDASTVVQRIRQRVLSEGRSSLVSCIEIEFLGIAALNLFLQLNYTGPTLEEVFPEASENNGANNPLSGINPHECFETYLQRSTEMNESMKPPDINKKSDKESLTLTRQNNWYHSTVLSELTVDGEWPCQVCEVPYFLLVARAILSTLENPNRVDWKSKPQDGKIIDDVEPSKQFIQYSSRLKGARLWAARATVAHERLIQNKEPSLTLWNEVEETFKKCIVDFCDPVESVAEATRTEARKDAATVMLEWGLAQHHFDRPKKGKKSFLKAVQYSGLEVEVTGAEGKRTKFQQKSTAQMLVRATSAATTDGNVTEPTAKTGESPELKGKNLSVTPQHVKHSEDELRLEGIRFDDDKENTRSALNILDQAILLSLCLDVKNSNPADGLTSEEMEAYLLRVLDNHDDWMIYATALLERSWLEFETTHGMERSILQIQALTDQHTNRLTITQSTRESVEDSAPPQDRLRNLHTIVYPPRWYMIQDLAERYAHLSIFSTAAELFLQIELWDEVVECYRRAGKESHALQIVKERLGVEETPRMLVALGDLTNDPHHYEKAVELSNGRFHTANIALGKYYSEKGDLQKAAFYYEKAVKIRPLAPGIWFRLGTIHMQTKNWDAAFSAFSVVVQQEPEEAQAWANVAAIHMQNKNPAEAYPALNESLKQNRNNWRVWMTKLYACLDLKKYDEAIQACNEILDLRQSKQASEGVPALEKKCVRAVVGGTLDNLRNSKNNEAGLDSSRRTLTRVQALLDRLQSSSDAEPWLFETIAYFYQQIGREDEMIENLMKEYRSLQGVTGWENDNEQVKKMCQLLLQITHALRRKGTKENLTRAKFLINGAISRVKQKRLNETSVPEEIEWLQGVLSEIEGEISNVS